MLVLNKYHVTASQPAGVSRTLLRYTLSVHFGLSPPILTCTHSVL